jgi:fructosamine-3-kinase
LNVAEIIRQSLVARDPTAGNILLNPVGGGSINDCYRISLPAETIFCKVNSATNFPHLFKQEKSGLAAIADTGLIKTPTVIDCFENSGYQFLLLEWIAEGERTDTFWQSFGRQLAALHTASCNTHGFREDNYMGSVPQSNKPAETWCSFFERERLQPMIQRCLAKGLLTKIHGQQFDVILKKLPLIFEEEPPSLLHGDLWSGNFICNREAEPVLIDPAVYYGHRSMDLAMTTLFGGFRPPFYEAYNHHFPLPLNYKEQWAICNLYPLLIHLYLFGSGYLPQIQTDLKQFC